MALWLCAGEPAESLYEEFGCSICSEPGGCTLMLASTRDDTLLQMEEQRAGKHTELPEFIFSHFQKRIGIPAAVVEVLATEHALLSQSVYCRMQ